MGPEKRREGSEPDQTLEADMQKMENGFDEQPRKGRTSPDDCFYSLCLNKPRKFTVGAKTFVICGYEFKNQNHRAICLSFCAMVAFLMIAIIIPMILCSATNWVINDQVVVDSESAPNYDLWHTNAHGTGYEKAKIKMDLYYFDLQNPEAVLYESAKPQLVERGPYSYDEFYYRFDIVWTDGGDTVSYYLQKYYVFNQETTAPGLQENDAILMPYPTVVGFKYVLDEIPPVVNEYFDEQVRRNLSQMERTLIGGLNNIYETILESERQNIISTPVRDQLAGEVRITNSSVVSLFDYLDSFLNQSSISLVLFKTLMCNSPSGVSPFWRTTPSQAWFGWFNDPILLQVQRMIDTVQALNRTGNMTIPWTSSVPGPTTNWTSVDEVRRRRSKDTFKTGKSNPKQVGAYVNYQNMSTVWTCIKPARSIHQEPWNEGTEFPACAHFQRDWTVAQAREHGYAQPFDGDYANRVHGSDCTLFGRPMTSHKAAVFISDVFRSAYAEHIADVKWYHGIPVKRFGIQHKDLLNATLNPENAQYYSFGPSGLLNLTVADNLPVFITFPHFYMADNSLIEAVDGVVPRKEIHETVVDVEPNTGALVRARKRLQVNYQVDTTAFPQVSEESQVFANAICANITDVLQKLIRLNIVDPNNVPTDYECNSILDTPFMRCLESPGTWNIRNDRIFHPYGWVEEAGGLTESDATEWNNSLFLVYRTADGLRFWGLIGAASCLLVILVVLYIERKEQQTAHAYNALKTMETESPVIQPLLPSPSETIHINLT